MIPSLQIPSLDDLTLLAATVKMEAEGEPYAGKLAVAFVICNRARYHGRSLKDVIFDPYDFSCWNTASPTRGRGTSEQ